MNVASCAAVSAVVLVGQALGGTAVVFGLVETKSSANGAVVMGESQRGDEIGYAIDVASGVNLNSFAVSLVTPFDPQITTPPSGWSHVEVSKEDWSKDFYGYAQVQGSTLGSFESLFGLVDDTVIVFTAPPTSFTTPGMTIPGGPGGMGMFIPGTTITSAGFMTDANDSDVAGWSAPSFTPPFLRQGGPSTEFIALDGVGNLIGQSFVVPEPSTALLSLLGCCAGRGSFPLGDVRPETGRAQPAAGRGSYLIL